MIKDFAGYDYDCCKVVREITIMRALRETATEKASPFIPKLVDLIIADTEEIQEVHSINEIFLVMEYGELDLRAFFERGNDGTFGPEQLRIVIYNLLCAVN